MTIKDHKGRGIEEGSLDVCWVRTVDDLALRVGTVRGFVNNSVLVEVLYQTDPRLKTLCLLKPNDMVATTQEDVVEYIMRTSA